MIQEDYCSFETSKQLKECGYPQSKFGVFYIEKTCTREYDEDYDGDMPIVGEVNYKEGEIISIDCTFDRNYEANPPRCVRPTLNQAMKWLREEKNIYVYIMLHPGGWWEFGLESTTSEEIEDNDMPNMNSSYEKAAEVGIVTALNNLKQ